jgi:putative membrane protein
MLRAKSLILSTAAALLAISGTAFAADKDSNSNIDSKHFVTKAAQANLAEIKTSQLALEKAQSPDVKSFAQRMIDDHQKANSELQSIAQSENLKVPDDTDMKHKAAMKMLQAKSGTGFDSAYIDQMNKDHDKTIALFQSAANSSKVDPQLKQFASKTLPILEQHHQLVAKLESNKESRSASAR